MIRKARSTSPAHPSATTPRKAPQNPAAETDNAEGDPFMFTESPVHNNTPENCNSTLTCPV